MKREKGKTLIGVAVLFAIPVLFYMFFALYDGPVICVDSPSYIEMSTSREPFYPAFLALFRMVFGGESDFYLKAVVVVQGLLTGYSTFSLVYFTYKESKVKYGIALLMTLICLGTSIACRFLAQRGSMYSTCIMTESICIPLFLLFSKRVLAYIVHKCRKDLIWAAIISLILVTTRKQMYISLFLLLFAIVYVQFTNENSTPKRIWYAFLSVLIVLGCVVGANKAFEYTYANIISGESYSHFNDNRFLTTVVFYVSEEEDSELLEDSEVRSLFTDIYRICDAEDSMMHSAAGSFGEKIQHFGEHYDMIQINHMWPMTEEFVTKCHPEFSHIEREQLVDEIFDDISWSILPHVWTKALRVFLRNMVQGLVNTVGKATISLMYPYALLAFGAYLILLIFSLIRKRYTFATIFAVYTLVAFFLNDGLVSALIFCQVRYMIYIMPLFYIALLLLIIDTFFTPKEVKVCE